jgi:ribonuclease HI
MEFVASFLLEWAGTRAFCKPFSPRDQWEFLLRTDASSDFGYGGMVVPLNEGTSKAWSAEERALALHPNLHAESSTVLELLALRNVLKVYGQRIRGTRVQIEMDSQTSVQNLRRWDSEKLPILEIVNEIHGLVISFSLEVRFEFIPREFNEIADALSIDSFPQAGEMFEREFGSQLTLTSASRL